LEIAGVGKGNFYHYFRSKDELGVAIIGEMERWFSSPAADEIFSHAKSPELRLADYLSYLATQRRRENHGDPLGNLLAELGDVEPFSKALRRALAALLDRVESVVTEYALERAITADARGIARLLVSEIHGLSAIYKVDRDEPAFTDGLRRVQNSLEIMVGAKISAPTGSLHPPSNT
jgi:TetR/AcrR family transcriptional regulator, transcriptional repressor for nem operon